MSYCVTLDVDGEPVRFQLRKPADQLSDEERAELITIARVVRQRMDEQTPKDQG